MTEQVAVFPVRVSSLVNTGSERNLLSIYHKLITVSYLEHSTITLKGFGNTIIKLPDFFSTNIIIHYSSYQTKDYLIPDHSLSFDSITAIYAIQQYFSNSQK